VETLHDILRARTEDWQANGWACDEYHVIGEILEWARNPDGSGFVLRAPQIQALEVYWYLRLVEQTPRVPDLYQKLIPSRSELLAALGIPYEAFERVDFVMRALWKALARDDEFVREFRLQGLRETMTLDYPSYILALAMGAGKTALIGAIIATEFAMAMEYPSGPFVQNALVFAPGTTIIQSLGELLEIPYDRILPPRLYRAFAASVKPIFTRDGDKNIPVISASSFNVVVTNTEKIRIQKETIRKRDIGAQLMLRGEDDARREIANARLQAIASLPHLAVFSDEAHHTYGQALDKGLKKVRKTVDYLHEKSPNLIAVINTTGTPYYQRQLLRDVVVWYGLSQGISSGILKEVGGNIQAFSFDETQTGQLLDHVIGDFFKDYGHVRLPNGAPARLAVYFPQTDDLRTYRPAIEAKLTSLGLPASLILENHTKAPQADIDAFARLNDPDAPQRVILLVNKGTEGWNCPSLFACALARKLKTSNNFVLQAASRCLRQVPGNAHKARIYLSADNYKVLDRQLQETFGETIAEVNHAASNSRRTAIRLRKLDMPPLVVTQVIRRVVRKATGTKSLHIGRPVAGTTKGIEKRTYTAAQQHATDSVLKQVGEAEDIAAVNGTHSVRQLAVEFAANYHLDLWIVNDALAAIYPGTEVPATDVPALAAQIEEQTAAYEVEEETVELALALVRPEGFNHSLAADGSDVYTAEITYPIDKESLLAGWDDWKDKAGDFGFHYTPYNFDSNPEKSFFEQMLDSLSLHPDEVQDIYFTGALTDPSKTDFYVEYRDEDGGWRRYTPDFIVRRKDGRCLIVEIKDARFRAATDQDIANHAKGVAAVTTEGRKAVALKRWEDLNPDRLTYQIIFADADVIPYDKMEEARTFAGGE
jgi:type III restriction enzyme